MYNIYMKCQIKKIFGYSEYPTYVSLTFILSILAPTEPSMISVSR